MAAGTIRIKLGDAVITEFTHDLPAGVSCELVRDGQTLEVCLTTDDSAVEIQYGEGPTPEELAEAAEAAAVDVDVDEEAEPEAEVETDVEPEAELPEPDGQAHIEDPEW